MLWHGAQSLELTDYCKHTCHLKLWRCTSRQHLLVCIAQSEGLRRGPDADADFPLAPLCLDCAQSTGLDKEGYPLLVELVGRIDLPGLYASVGEEGFLRFVAWYHEVQETVMARIAAAANAPRHMMDVVIDMAGLSTRHASTSVYKVLSKRTRLEEDNYPEVCKRVSIVRAPGLFSGIWSMVKGFMDPGTRAKVQIASASSTPEVMANIAEKSQLPPQVDGTMTTVRLPQGGVLPQHFIAGYGTTGESRLLAKGAAEYQWIPLPAKGGVSVSWQVADGKDVEVAAWAVPAGTLAPPGAAARSVVGPLMPALGMQCALLADLPAETEPWFEKRLPYAVVRAPRDAAGAAPLFEGDTLGDSLPPGAVVQECSVMTAPQGSPPDVAQCVLAPKRAANDTFTHVVTADSAAQPPALAPVLEAGFSTGTHSAEAASAGAPTEAITALQARVSNVAKNAPGGYLVLRWSNTYAWMHSKTVARQVKLWVE